MIADKILPLMELRELTEDEQALLKLGIMSLYENRLISSVAASWLIQSLELSNV